MERRRDVAADCGHDLVVTRWWWPAPLPRTTTSGTGRTVRPGPGHRTTPAGSRRRPAQPYHRGPRCRASASTKLGVRPKPTPARPGASTSLDNRGTVVGSMESAIAGIGARFAGLVAQPAVLPIGPFGQAGRTGVAVNGGGAIVGTVDDGPSRTSSAATVPGARRLRRRRSLAARPSLWLSAAGYQRHSAWSWPVRDAGGRSVGTTGSCPSSRRAIVPNSRQGGAAGVNQAGVIVGCTTGTNGYSQAAIWEDGTVRSLGTLGGLGSGPSAINDFGVVTVGTRPPAAGFREPGLRLRERDDDRHLGRPRRDRLRGQRHQRPPAPLVGGYTPTSPARRACSCWTARTGRSTCPHRRAAGRTASWC